MSKTGTIARYILLGNPRNFYRKVVATLGNRHLSNSEEKFFTELFRGKKGLRIGGVLQGEINRIAEENSKIIDVNASDHYLGKKNTLKYKSDATSLSFAKDKSQDFVCSSHLLEHVSNPIKAIIEWKRVIKRRGFIYCAVPDKRFTFDHRRNLTTLEHLRKDYLENTLPKDMTHYNDLKENYDEDMDWITREDYLKYAKENPQINIHHHVWTKKSLKKMFENLNFKIIFCKRKGNTIHIVVEVS